MNADFLCLSIFLIHFSQPSVELLDIKLSKNASLRIFASYCLFNKIFVCCIRRMLNSTKMRTNYDGLYICIMMMMRGRMKDEGKLRKERNERDGDRGKYAQISE